MTPDAYKCFRCGSSDRCEHDREHDWTPPVLYRFPGGPAQGLRTCHKCRVSILDPWPGPSLGSAVMGPFNPWDGRSDCLEVRDAREKAVAVEALRIQASVARIADFLAIYPEGFYWVRFALESSSPRDPRVPFVMFLDHRKEAFVPVPREDSDFELGVHGVEVLGPCPIPEEVLQKFSVEVVMLT